MNVKASNLKKYYGEKAAVNGVNLEIRQGKILGLLGPNGAGKSTIIKILSGQIPPSEGIIEINGKEYPTVPKDLRGEIGVMPQEVILWDELTVEENLYFTAKLQEIPVKKAKERIDELIEGLNLQKELKTYAKNLSGGFKRRLNLAISILHEPSLIFLDEPTPGIDPQNRRFLWEFVKKLRDSGKYSIVLTDHYLDEAEQLSDYVVIIDDGKVIAEGTVQELKKTHGNGLLVQVSFDEEETKKETEITQLVNELKQKYKEVDHLENIINILTEEGTSALEEVLKLLSKNKLKANNIGLKEPSLEDIFLILTGKAIRE
jgi:ABC-2 type transport system ATP-binding protein